MYIQLMKDILTYLFINQMYHVKYIADNNLINIFLKCIII